MLRVVVGRGVKRGEYNVKNLIVQQVRGDICNPGVRLDLKTTKSSIYVFIG